MKCRNAIRRTEKRVRRPFAEGIKTSKKYIFKNISIREPARKISRASRCSEMTNEFFASVAHCEEIIAHCAETLLKEEFIRKSLSN